MCVSFLPFGVVNFERIFLANGSDWQAHLLTGKRGYSKESIWRADWALFALALGLRSGGEGATAPSPPRHPPLPHSGLRLFLSGTVREIFLVKYEYSFSSSVHALYFVYRRLPRSGRETACSARARQQ